MYNNHINLSFVNNQLTYHLKLPLWPITPKLITQKKESSASPLPMLIDEIV